MKYQRKPTTVEAWQVIDPDTKKSVPVWITAAMTGEDPEVYPQKDDEGEFSHLVVRTNHGPVRADIGDWILNGDDLYPVKPSVFEALYEPLLERTSPYNPILERAITGYKRITGSHEDKLMGAIGDAYHEQVMIVARFLTGMQSEEALDSLARAFGYESARDAHRSVI